MKTEKQLWDIFDSCKETRINTIKIHEKINSEYCTLWGCFSTYEKALEEVEHRLANDGKP